MNILITGVHGFIGTNLVKQFPPDYKIYGVDIVSPENDRITRTYGWDELDKLPPVDMVIHLAGKAHDTKKHSGTEIYFEVNTGLTQKIFDYFLGSGATKFVFFSSVKAAADFVPGDILTEDVKPAPVGPYGESKMKAEEYINEKYGEYAKTCGETGKQVYILRPAMTHGPGNKGNLNLLYDVVKRGIPWPLGKFDNKRSFTSIDNLSFIINRLAAMDVPSGTYNIADDDPLPTNEIIRIICSVRRKKCRIWNIPVKLITFAAGIGTILHLPLNKDRLNKLTENYVVSNAKIKAAIGIDELPVNSAEGLKKTIDSFSGQ